MEREKMDVETKKENKIISNENIDNIEIKADEIKESNENKTNSDKQKNESTIKDNTKINNQILIKSTELRLPSKFIDISYDNPQNK